MHTIRVEHLGALRNRATRYDNKSSVVSNAPAGSGGARYRQLGRQRGRR